MIYTYNFMVFNHEIPVSYVMHDGMIFVLPDCLIKLSELIVKGFDECIYDMVEEIDTFGAHNNDR